MVLFCGFFNISRCYLVEWRRLAENNSQFVATIIALNFEFGLVAIHSCFPATLGAVEPVDEVVPVWSVWEFDVPHETDFSNKKIVLADKTIVIHR